MTGSKWILMLSAAALLAPVTAMAQDSEESRGGVEDIIVTAQRRSESLTDVPLSIVAATSETLRSKGLESITDLRFQTPGFISLVVLVELCWVLERLYGANAQEIIETVSDLLETPPALSR